jgi:hypothetical protein
MLMTCRRDDHNFRINNFIETRKDEGNFKKQVLIENIEYIGYNKIQTTVIAKMINKFNPNSKFKSIH